MPRKETIRIVDLALANIRKPAAAASAVRPSEKSYYDASELEHFRKIILLMRQEALEEIRYLRNLMKAGRPGSPGSEGTHAGFDTDSPAITLTEEGAFLLQRQLTFIGHLEKALRRIESGSFGLCRMCGSLIEWERLEAVPHTQHCVRCKTSGRHVA